MTMERARKCPDVNRRIWTRERVVNTLWGFRRPPVPTKVMNTMHMISEREIITDTML